MTQHILANIYFPVNTITQKVASNITLYDRNNKYISSHCDNEKLLHWVDFITTICAGQNNLCFTLKFLRIKNLLKSMAQRVKCSNAQLLTFMKSTPGRTGSRIAITNLSSLFACSVNYVTQSAATVKH